MGHTSGKRCSRNDEEKLHLRLPPIVSLHQSPQLRFRTHVQMTLSCDICRDIQGQSQGSEPTVSSFGFIIISSSALLAPDIVRDDTPAAQFLSPQSKVNPAELSSSHWRKASDAEKQTHFASNNQLQSRTPLSALRRATGRFEFLFPGTIFLQFFKKAQCIITLVNKWKDTPDPLELCAAIRTSDLSRTPVYLLADPQFCR